MKELLPTLPAKLDDVLSGIAYFKPEICLTVLFLLVLAADLIFRTKSARISRIIACAGLGVVIIAGVYQYATVAAPRLLFSNALLIHRPAVLFKLGIDVLAVVLLLYFPWDAQLKKHPKGLGDAYTIIVSSVLGLHLMVMAANLLTIYLSVEMVSIASYLLVAYQSNKALSAEASLKYILFGMASSAVMLYGISLLYAFTGSISVYNPAMAAILHQLNPSSVILALLLILAGIGFKLGAVPLHFWVPDVYQGSATPVMAYISTLPKIAAFGLLLNFLMPLVYDKQGQFINYQTALAITSIITMLVGNFAAIWQTNVKRLLAYSGIGHTGFALMAALCFTAQGISALSFYLFIYAIANIGTLALASYFSNVAGAEEVADYSGLGIRYPVASVCFVILLISLTGLPVTAGFNAKLLVFSAIYTLYKQTGNLWLLAALGTGALTTVVSLFYYFKIPLHLFLRRSSIVHSVVKIAPYLAILVVIITICILLLGIFPDYLSNYL